MGTQTNSGITIALAAVLPSTYNAAGFAALSWVEIGEVKTGGDFGKTFKVTTSETLDRRGTRKKKGTFDAGKLNPSIDLDKDDAGQQLAQTARDSDNDYPVRVVLQDGTVNYMVGLVYEFVTNIGGPNDMLGARIGIDLQPFVDSDGYEVAAITV